MRKPSRRSIATLIRVRQELDKRLDAVLPGWGDASALQRLVDPRVAAHIGVGGSDPCALRRALAGRAAGRFPLVVIRRRAPETLPARDALDRSVAAAARGDWSVFGAPVRVDPSRHEWTRHPTTGSSGPAGHWARLAYMDGVGGGDVKSIWELSRHAHLVRLAQGYFLTRDEALATALLELLDRWIDQNPRGHGVNWASSLEVAFRAIAWCWIWALTCESPEWTDARLARFLVAVWHHARHIERFDSIHHSPNTHLTGEALGLLYVGLWFPELRRSAHWARRGREILESELDAQVLADGMHFERAVGYHRYTAEFYLHFLLLADAFGLHTDAALRRRVRSQVAAARLLRRPDGSWPVIGDEDSGSTLSLTTTDPQDNGPLLAIGGAIFDEPEWMAKASDAHRAAGWWLLDDARWDVLRRAPRASDHPTPESPRWTPSGGALEQAGYFVGREHDGADAWWCLVDAGPHGGDRTGHAHTDLGHVEISKGSTLIVVDPGCPAYTTDRTGRDWIRSEFAHACLVIDGSPLAAPSGPFSWAHIAPIPSARWRDEGRMWWCELSYTRDHAAGRLTHRRQVALVRGCGIAVCDWFDGDAPPSLALHWPLGDAPGTATLSGCQLHGRTYDVTWGTPAGDDQLRASLEPMKRSPGYGRQLEAQLLRVEYAGALPGAVATIFAEASRRAGIRVDGDAGGSRRALIEFSTQAGDRPVVLVFAPNAAPTLERAAGSNFTREVAG